MGEGGRNECEGEAPVLAVTDHEGDVVFAHAVPRQGPEPSAVAMACEDLELLGIKPTV